MKHLLKHASTFAIASALACGGGGGGGGRRRRRRATQTCQDGVAILALRDAIKDVYNFKLQGRTRRPAEPDDGVPARRNGDGHGHRDVECRPGHDDREPDVRASRRARTRRPTRTRRRRFS